MPNMTKKLKKLKYYLRKTWKEELRKADSIRTESQRALDDLAMAHVRKKNEHARVIRKAKKQHRMAMSELAEAHCSQLSEAFETHKEMFADVNLPDRTAQEKYTLVSARLKVHLKLHSSALKDMDEEKAKVMAELQVNRDIIERLEKLTVEEEDVLDAERKSVESNLVLLNESGPRRNVKLFESESDFKELVQIAKDEMALMQDKREYLAQRMLSVTQEDDDEKPEM